MKKTPFDHRSNEYDCLKNTKVKVSRMNFEFVTIICFSEAFSEICSTNDESEDLIPTIGLWFTLLLVLCFRLLLLFKFFIIALTNKHFYFKINYFSVNKTNC